MIISELFGNTSEKKIMKGIRLTFATFACLATLCFAGMDVRAAGESASVSGGGQVEVGDTVSVSLTVNCSDGVWGHESVLSYDSNILEYVSASGGTVNGGGGQISITGAYTQAGAQTITISFKTRATGSSNVALIQSIISNGDSEVDCRGAATAVTVANPAPAPQPQAPTEWGNAALSSITVSPGKLSPAFESGTFEYAVEVEDGTTAITVSATTVDPTSRVIAVNGSKSIEHGINYVTVVAEAEEGNRLTYTLVVYCGVNLDGTDKEKQELDVNPCDVTVGAKQYVISDYIPAEEVPEGFTKFAAEYGGKKVLAVKNTKLGISLVYLLDKKDEETQEGTYFILDEKTSTVYPYFKITLSEGRQIVLLQPEAELTVADGLKISTTEVLGQSFYCCSKKDEEILYFYAVNQDGKRGWYRYDPADKTYQSFDMEAKLKEERAVSDLKNELEKSEQNKFTFMVAAISAAVLFLITLIIAIVYIVKYRKTFEYYDEDEEQAESENPEAESEDADTENDEIKSEALDAENDETKSEALEAENDETKSEALDAENDETKSETTDTEETATDINGLTPIDLDAVEEVISQENAESCEAAAEAEGPVETVASEENAETEGPVETVASEENAEPESLVETVASEENVEAEGPVETVASEENVEAEGPVETIVSEENAETESLENVATDNSYESEASEFVPVDLSFVEEIINDNTEVTFNTFHNQLDASMVEMELNKPNQEKKLTIFEEADDDYKTTVVESDDDYKTAVVEADDDYKTAIVEPDDDYARVSTRHKAELEETSKVEFEFVDLDD